MKNLTIRFEDDVYQELKSLAELTGQSLNATCNLCVRSEYAKVGDDPKVKLAFDQLNQLKDLLSQFNEQTKINA